MRKHLIWVLGLALVVAVSGIATAANTQSLSAGVTPNKLPKSKLQGVKLNVTTEAGSTDVGAGAVKPATQVDVFFDNDITFNPKGIATCAKNKVQDLDTAQAKAACPKAIVGSGKATAYVTGNPSAATTVSGTITAFNGPPQGNKPTIVLHTRVDAVATTTALTGVLSKAGGDLGNKLAVTVPLLPGGTALGLFQTTVTKKTGKNNYVSAKCGDKNKTLNFKGVYKYSGGEPSKTVLAKQSCKVK